MYAVPAKAETFGATETILGPLVRRRRRARRQKVVLATKVAGPSRGMPWVRAARRHAPGRHRARLRGQPEAACRPTSSTSTRSTGPTRNVPAFGQLYFDPTQGQASHLDPRPAARRCGKLVKAGKVRAIGLSNETPYGVHEFVRLAEQHGLPRVATVQNPYCLINRSHDNGLDETCTAWACRCWPIRRWASGC